LKKKENQEDSNEGKNKWKGGKDKKNKITIRSERKITFHPPIQAIGLKVADMWMKILYAHLYRRG